MNLLKTNILFALLLGSCLVACQTEPAGMTPEEEATARKEISARIAEVVRGAARLDVAAAAKPYADTPEFRIVSPDGSVADYAGMMKAQTEFFKTLSSITFTTKQEDFQFLSKTRVLCTWQGSNAFALRTGERFNISAYTGSLLFSKQEGGEWKIIYAHESAVAPVLVPASRPSATQPNQQ